MVKVILYKECPFNNGSVMSNFTDISQQADYFAGIPASNKRTFTDVKLSSLYEPIVLNVSIPEIFEYTYGQLILIENERPFYFSVNRFEIVTETKTLLYFDIDYWETYRYQIGTGNKLKIGRGKITRSNLDLHAQIIRPITPQAITQEVKTLFQSLAGHTKRVIFTYHSNVTNKNWIYVMNTTAEINDLIGFDFSVCDSGDGGGNKIDPENITGCWVDPFDDWWYTIFNQVWTDGTRTLYRAELGQFNGRTQSTITWTIPELASYDPAIEQYGLTDMAGNLVWVTDGFKYTGNIKFSLNITMTTARWFVYIERSNDMQPPVYTNGECRATIPCEPMDIFSDTFTQYAIQQRPFTEQARLIQKNQTAVNSIANIGTSAIGGAVAGSMVAPGTGTVAGAVGGAVSSLMGTAINYGTTDYFNQQIQANEDNQALVQTDNLRFEGSAIGDYLRDYCGVSIIKLSVDGNTRRTYLQDYATFGHYYNYYMPRVDDLLSLFDEFKMVCDAEIENVPAIASISVNNRLRRGVTFIRPSWE